MKGKTVDVSVALSDAEVLELGKEQGALLAEYHRLQTARARMGEIWKRLMVLSEQCSTRTRAVKVPVREEPDDVRKRVVFVRTDVETRQVVGHRDMTPEELEAAKRRARQVKLPIVKESDDE